MDDKFIKEKLDLVAKDDELIEEPVPDSLKALNKQYAQIFAERQNKKQPVRRRYLVPVFSSVAAAVLVCVALLCFSFFHKPEEDTRYGSDFEYIEEQIPYEQIVENYEIFSYGNEYTIIDSFVKKIATNSQIVVASVSLRLPDGELRIDVSLYHDYEYPDENMYKNLQQKASTDLFEYSYKIFPEDNAALAMCEYNNYTYYFRYSSPYPEDITIIMNSMRA